MMAKLTIDTTEIQSKLLAFNQSAEYELIGANLQKLFTINVLRTLGNKYVLIITNLQGITKSLATGSFGWDLNSTDTISYAYSLDGKNILFTIPNYLLEGFV
jgi:hypothetical protein